MRCSCRAAARSDSMSRPGVRKYLYERKIGFETRVAKVPIVPGAIIFDLGVGNRPDIWPTADCGYRAAAAATERCRSPKATSARVPARRSARSGGGGPMKGGLGTASIAVPRAPTRLVVGGDRRGERGGRRHRSAQRAAVVAGVRTPDGKGLADARKLLRAGAASAESGRDRTRRSASSPPTRA